MIYVLQAEGGGLVKIGYTAREQATRRVAELQLASPVPLRLLHTMPGRVRDEQRLHARFQAQRRHGEWFTPEGDLLAWLSALPRLCPLGPLTRRYQQVLTALDDDWRRGSEIAARSACSPMHVGQILQSLQDRWGRVESRTRHHRWTPYAREWRVLRDAGVTQQLVGPTPVLALQAASA